MGWWSRAEAYLKLIRPPLTVLGFLASSALLRWSGRLCSLDGLLVILSIGLANVGWTVANEIVDVEVDRVNKPWKPLPSGRAGMREAILIAKTSIAASLFALIALILATGNPVYLLGLAGHLSSCCYNVLDRGLLGNACMGFTYGLAALLSLYPEHLLFAPVFALITISFNLLVQYQDLKAEKTMGRRVAPEQLGEVGTFATATILSIICLILLYVMYVDEGYRPLLLFMVVSLLIVASAISIILPIPEHTKSVVIESCERRLSRFLMIIGFLYMLMT
jgi:geranylgeranylglycerol-phosphate geranylgeranyltransferase